MSEEKHGRMTNKARKKRRQREKIREMAKVAKMLGVTSPQHYNECVQISITQCRKKAVSMYFTGCAEWLDKRPYPFEFYGPETKNPVLGYLHGVGRLVPYVSSKLNFNKFCYDFGRAIEQIALEGACKEYNMKRRFMLQQSEEVRPAIAEIVNFNVAGIICDYLYAQAKDGQGRGDSKAQTP